MPELTRKTAAPGEPSRLFFCHIPKAAGQSIIKLFERERWTADWSIMDAQTLHPNYFEIRLHYKRQDQKPPPSFAICRHPMRRIESAFAHNKRAENPGDMFRQLEELESGQIFTIWQKHLRPASDLVLDTTKIFHFEDGLEQAVAKMASLRWIPYKAKIEHIAKTKKQKLDWSKAPSHIVDKIMRVYAQDYYHFGYPLFPDD